MVSFTCHGCNDTIKKPKLDQHYQRCFSGFDCLDCSQTFNVPAEWKTHTSCVTEDQKYQKTLYKGPKNVSTRGRGGGQRGRGNPRAYSSGANETPLGAASRMPPPQESSSTTTEPSPSQNNNKKRKHDEFEEKEVTVALSPNKRKTVDLTSEEKIMAGRELKKARKKEEKEERRADKAAKKQRKEQQSKEKEKSKSETALPTEGAKGKSKKSSSEVSEASQSISQETADDEKKKKKDKKHKSKTNPSQDATMESSTKMDIDAVEDTHSKKRKRVDNEQVVDASTSKKESKEAKRRSKEEKKALKKAKKAESAVAQ